MPHLILSTQYLLLGEHAAIEELEGDMGPAPGPGSVAYFGHQQEFCIVAMKKRYLFLGFVVWTLPGAQQALPWVSGS